MSRRTITIAELAAVAIVLFAVAARWIYYSENPKGFENVELCHGIREGITLSELTAILGDPVHKYEYRGRMIYKFETPAIMAGMIRAEVNESENLVLALWCDEDGPPQFQIDRDTTSGEF
jgi:hypothetical protein